ncbi:MAG: hypothetical protein AB7G54_01970 [Methyloceanibacter sp.]
MRHRIMSDWIDINQWDYCHELARPGIVFEIRNAEEQSMIAHCAASVPSAPFDWKSAPVKFRAIVELPPQLSQPIPGARE